MFKKLIFTIAILSCLLVTSISKAEDFNLTMKQGFIAPWSSLKVENFTAFETLTTKPVEDWGNWNVFVDGWSLDVGIPYDAGDNVDTFCLMLGRQFGTLGKYIPFLNFPLADKFEITLYPIGLYITDVYDDIKFEGASGGAFFEASIKF